MKEVHKETYIKTIAIALLANRKRIDSLHSKKTHEMSLSQRQKHEAALNWECMLKSKNEERISVALGLLKISELRDFYDPSAFHKYDGIKSEMQNIKFV